MVNSKNGADARQRTRQKGERTSDGKKRLAYIAVGLVLLVGLPVAAVSAFRSAIPFGTASSWSSAVNADPNAVRGPWFNTNENAMAHTNTGGSGTDWQLDQITYSVKAFGAKGDNVTDDSTAIQSAITAANAAGGGRVYFPAGTYRSTQVTLASVSNIVLEGVQATIVGTVETNSVIELNGCTKCEVTGLTVQHATTSARNSTGEGILVLSSSNVVINKNTINPVCSAGIFLHGPNNSFISVTNNYVNGSLADGIATYFGSSDVSVIGNHANNTGDDSISIVAYQSTGNQNSRVAIVGNTVFNSASHGIVCVGGQYVTIANNVIDTTLRAGIQFSQDASADTLGSSHGVISGNVITGTGSTVDHEADIYILGSNATFPVFDVKVIGNVTNGGSFDFIKANGTVGSAVLSVSVTGNKAYGPNASRNGITFVQVLGGEIKGNHILQAFADGVNVDATSTNVVTGDNVISLPNQGNAAGIHGSFNASTNAQIGDDYVLADGGKTALVTTQGTSGTGISHANTIDSGNGTTIALGGTNANILQWTYTAAQKTVLISQAPNDTNGSVASYQAGAAGNASASGGGVGGTGQIIGGAGGDSDGTHSAGAGGTGRANGATGGAGSGLVAGAKGGTGSALGGTGGASSGASGTAGAGGDAQCIGGPAGAANGGTGASGGDGILRGGAHSGSASDGQVLIGDSQTSAIGIGASGITTTITGNEALNGTLLANQSQRWHRITVANTGYTVLSTDTIVAYTSINAARVVTMSCATNAASASAFEMVVKDESGSASGTNTITITPSFGTIDGSASKVCVNSAFGACRVYSNGTNCFTW